MQLCKSLPQTVINVQRILVIAICFLPQPRHCLRWLSLAKVASVGTSLEPDSICDNMNGLARRQKHFCKKNPDIMESIRKGAAIATEECQYQFRHRLWNCSSADTVKLYGTRESAFIHAISSAAVAHAVTKACSAGSLKNCECDHSVRGRSPEGFQWSGCSDNIAFGSAYASSFVDPRKRKGKPKSARELMNLHNNKAGRQAIEGNMQIPCKCHGVSGSCQVKTCWRSIASFRHVGTLLKEKFDGASEVIMKKDKKGRELTPKHRGFRFNGDTDLVYLEPSPDFCVPNDATGSHGTQGRLCNKTSPYTDGCDIMCCGRGFVTKTVIKRERCKCSFRWCCEVRCQQCDRREETYMCA